MKDKIGLSTLWLVIAIAIICILLLGGCASHKEVEYIHTHDTVYQNKVVHDSVDRWHTHYEFVQGDTKYVYDTFYCDKWHLKVDTLINTEIVTLPPEKEYVEVEKKVYVWWPVLVAIGAIFVLYLFRKKIILWLKKLIPTIR